MPIDFIRFDRKFYTYEAFAWDRIVQVLQKNRIPFRTIYLQDGVLQDYFYSLQNWRPDWTLSFINPTPQQMPLCDLIQIPHFCWVEQSVAFAYPYLDSHFGKLGIPSLDTFSKLAHPKAYFLPHGIEEVKQEEKREFDLIFFGNLIDLEFLKKSWEELFQKEEIASIERGIQKNNPFLAGPLSYYVDMFLKAQRDYQRIVSIYRCRIDVFGEHVGHNWLIRLPNREKVYLHSQLPYSEHFEVLKMSRTALIAEGEQWYFEAIAAGCLPVQDEKEACHYLAHPEKKEEKLKSLQDTLRERSWERQVKKLFKVMECK